MGIAKNVWNFRRLINKRLRFPDNKRLAFRSLVYVPQAWFFFICASSFIHAPQTCAYFILLELC